MGQTTRSQGISFTHEMWDRIEARSRDLRNSGRSQYFQMLVNGTYASFREIHAHKADGGVASLPEHGAGALQERSTSGRPRTPRGRGRPPGEASRKRRVGRINRLPPAPLSVRMGD